jgi:hypothetical protein
MRIGGSLGMSFLDYCTVAFTKSADRNYVRVDNGQVVSPWCRGVNCLGIEVVHQNGAIGHARIQVRLEVLLEELFAIIAAGAYACQSSLSRRGDTVVKAL